MKVDTCLNRHAQSVVDDDEIGDAHVPVPLVQFVPTQLPGTTFPSSSTKPEAAGLLARDGIARVATDSVMRSDAAISVRVFFERKVDRDISVCIFFLSGLECTTYSI